MEKIDYIQLQTEIYGFVLYPVDAYDTRGKRLFSSKRCYYVVDSGLRKAAVSPLSRNTGSLLKNTVFLELNRRRYEIVTGYTGEKSDRFSAG